MTLPDPSRVPGAEPLSTAQIDILDTHLSKSWVERQLTHWDKEALRAALRELQALRAERTAAPASGEVQAQLRAAYREQARAVSSMLEMSTLSSDEVQFYRGKLAGIEQSARSLDHPVLASLTPQQDVQTLVTAIEGLRLLPTNIVTADVQFMAGHGAAIDEVLGILARVPPAPQPVERWFPIQHGAGLPSIPWSVIAPHEKQALENHRQTLDRLAERHGLSPCEAVAVIEDRPWHPMTDAEAVARLNALVAAAAAPPAPAAQARSAGRVEELAREINDAVTEWTKTRTDTRERTDVILAALQRASETGDE